MPLVNTTYRVSINTRPETVFAYVADLTRHGEWSGGQLKVEPVGAGPVGVGSQYVSHGEVPGQKDRPNELRVTQYQPPARFAFVAKDPSFGDVVHEFAFKPEAGGTLLERTVSINMPALTAFAYRTFIRPLIGKPMMDKALVALKAKLEQPAKP